MLCAQETHRHGMHEEPPEGGLFKVERSLRRIALRSRLKLGKGNLRERQTQTAVSVSTGVLDWGTWSNLRPNFGLDETS